MSNNPRVLFVEDEQNIITFVAALLESNDFSVISAKSCSEGEMLFLSHNPDLIVLDLGLPDGDGLDLLKTVRKTSDVPIIVLSARNDENNKVEALDLGANDYVTKPFGPKELVARMRNALRNQRRIGQNKCFVLDDLKIDYDARSITVTDNEIRFTQTEYNIIVLLSEHAGKVLTYSSIISSIWGYNDIGSTKKLQVNMANIRKKFGDVPGGKNYITNELGVGYKMNL